MYGRESEKFRLRDSPQRTQLLATEVTALNKLLERGLAAFNQCDLSGAAAQFRQVARDIKRLEESLFTTGKYSPRNTLNNLTGTEWLRHTKSWFILDGKAADIDEAIENHPGSFPPELAAHFIEFFTKEGGMVLDPFVGIGSTLAAAANLQRNCIGVELNPEFAKYAGQRIGGIAAKNLTIAVHTADARSLRTIWEDYGYPPVDLCFTSPPYWNMLGTSRGGVESTLKQRVKGGYAETYSNDPRDLGNIDSYDEYISELVAIFAQLTPILQDKAYLVIVLQNCRPKDGIMRPLAWDVARKLNDTYDLRQEFVWMQDQKSLGIWGYPTTYVSNVHHHYCLVLQKSI